MRTELYRPWAAGRDGVEARAGATVGSPTVAVIWRYQRTISSVGWGRRRADPVTAERMTGRSIVYLQRLCRRKNPSPMLSRRKDSQQVCSGGGRTGTPARVWAGRWWLLAHKKVFLSRGVWLEKWGLEAGEEEWALLGRHLDWSCLTMVMETVTQRRRVVMFFL